jgi:hypothetical protein
LGGEVKKLHRKIPILENQYKRNYF